MICSSLQTSRLSLFSLKNQGFIAQCGLMGTDNSWALPTVC